MFAKIIYNYISKTDDYGRTALHYAVVNSKLLKVKLLLKTIME
jgi:ankyrin repeat protein